MGFEWAKMYVNIVADVVVVVVVVVGGGGGGGVVVEVDTL